MSDNIKPGTVTVAVVTDQGQPCMTFDVGPGNFWELMPCPPGRRAGRWVLVHWVPGADEDDFNCDDVKEFKEFEAGLVAFGTVVRLVREGLTPRPLKELTKPTKQGDLPRQRWEPLPKETPMPADHPLHLSSREASTILAALRVYQRMGGAANLDQDLAEIANDHGQFTPLDSDQIDALCEGINCD